MLVKGIQEKRDLLTEVFLLGVGRDALEGLGGYDHVFFERIQQTVLDGLGLDLQVAISFDSPNESDDNALALRT